MTPELIHILQHSLGCDQYGQTDYRGHDEGDGCWHYSRNRFVTDPAGQDGIRCQELGSMGFMADHGPQSIAGGMHCYTVTAAGRDAMIQQSPKKPKVSLGRRRYRAFRDLCEVCPDLTFHEFLTHPNFAESRARA